MDGDGISNVQDEDIDGDELSDRWELMHGLSPNDPSDALQDPDYDGFSNFKEYQGGSDPNSGDETPETISKAHSTGSSGIINSSLIIMIVIILMVILVAVVVLRGSKPKKTTQQPATGTQAVHTAVQRPYEVQTPTPRPSSPTLSPTEPKIDIDMDPEP